MSKLRICAKCCCSSEANHPHEQLVIKIYPVAMPKSISRVSEEWFILQSLSVLCIEDLRRDWPEP